MKKSILLLVLIAFIIGMFAGSAHIYGFGHALNGGITWNWGGFEFYGDPGLFFCTAEWNQAPYEIGSPWAFLAPYWLNIFPVADCA